MTAEIVIMNKEGVAIAADSAVTFRMEGGHKIFTSANKLFALSKFHPVGIMIYGSANFMDIPWETVIKIFRSRLGNSEYNSLKDYSKAFFRFLEKSDSLVTDSVKKDFVIRHVITYFHKIKYEIMQTIKDEMTVKGKIEKKEIKKIISETITRHFVTWDKTKTIPTVSKSKITEFRKKIEGFVEKAITGVFEKLPLYQKNKKQLSEIAVSLFVKFPKKFRYSGLSGVVFAGFGKKEMFPSVLSYDLEGLTEYFLKYNFNEDSSQEISFDLSASIMPFAQGEMVYSFMEGIDPFLEMEIDRFLGGFFQQFPKIIVDSVRPKNSKDRKEILEKLKKVGGEFLKKYEDRMSSFRKKNYSDPVVSVTASMTKSELVSMAEAFVNLTSFKRKVTMEEETVGGPIDVAVISKGDGFIWIKRKHYFEKELNPRYLATINREKINARKK